MRKIGQYCFALIAITRWGNVLFIGFLIFISSILIYKYDAKIYNEFNAIFIPLALSTMLIAAGGYLINDYFDSEIDTINAPHRIRNEKIVGKKHLILWHFIFSILGVIIAFYCIFTIQKLRLISLQLLSITLLFFYSFIFKKKIFIGNFIISLLASLAAGIIPAYAYQKIYFPHLYQKIPSPLNSIFLILIIFSLLTTLIREIIKDIEDIKGDLTYNCKTIPIVFGINRTKTLIQVFNGLYLFGFIFFFYPISHNFLGIILFVSQCITIFGLIYFIYIAKKPNDFTFPSNLVKISMLLGCLSILML